MAPAQRDKQTDGPHVRHRELHLDRPIEPGGLLELCAQSRGRGAGGVALARRRAADKQRLDFPQTLAKLVLDRHADSPPERQPPRRSRVNAKGGVVHTPMKRRSGSRLSARGAGSKRFRQTRLPKDRVRGVSAGNADGHRKMASRDRAQPNFVTAASLSHEFASRLDQQVAQRTIELRRHSCGRGNRFAHRHHLNENGFGRHARMIVRRKVDSHVARSCRAIHRALARRRRQECRRNARSRRPRPDPKPPTP